MLLAQWIVLGVWSMGRGLKSIRVIGGVWKGIPSHHLLRSQDPFRKKLISGYLKGYGGFKLLCLDSMFYREIVAAAHLKPLDKGDKLQFEDKIVSPWNVAANGQTSVKLEQSTNQSEVSVPVAIRYAM